MSRHVELTYYARDKGTPPVEQESKRGGWEHFELDGTRDWMAVASMTREVGATAACRYLSSQLGQAGPAGLSNTRLRKRLYPTRQL